MVSDMSTEQIVASMLKLGDQVTMWQSQYNKAAVEIENFKGEGQLRVLVGEPAELVLEAIGAYQEDIEHEE